METPEVDVSPTSANGFINALKPAASKPFDFQGFFANSAVESVKKQINDAKAVKRTDMGLSYDPTSIDSYLDALNQSEAWKRDDTALSRFIDQARANGINPALLLSSSDMAGAFSTNNNSVKGSTVSANKKRDASTLYGLVATCAAMVGAVGSFLKGIASVAGAAG